MKRFAIAAVLVALILPVTAGAHGLNVTAGYPGVSMYDVGSGVGPVQESGEFAGVGWDIDASSIADYGYLGAMVQGVRDHPWTADPFANSAMSKALSDDMIVFGSGSGTFKVIMDFDGELEVNGARFTTAQVQLHVRYGSFLSTALLREKQLYYDDPAGHLLTFDEHLVSDPIPFGSGGDGVHLVTDLLTIIELGGFTDESMAARSDFLNTARILYLEVRDDAGNLMDVSAVGASGHVYPVNIPEPASFACFALALCVANGRRRA